MFMCTRTNMVLLVGREPPWRATHHKSPQPHPVCTAVVSWFCCHLTTLCVAHLLAVVAAGRARRRSSTAGLSTAGGRSPGAALLALVSTQVSPIRQRLLAEAGVQRAKRGTDLLRNSWPLVSKGTWWLGRGEQASR
jgi:hypothetical protein